MVWLTRLPDDWWNTYAAILLDPPSIVALTDELLFITRTLLMETRIYARVCKRSSLSSNDFHAALDSRHVPPLHLRSDGGEENTIISLSSLVERADRSVLRTDGIKMTMHWLAIDGEEPLIPENPTPNFDDKIPAEIHSILDSPPKVTVDVVQQQSPMIQKLFAMSFAAQDQ